MRAQPVSIVGARGRGGKAPPKVAAVVGGAGFIGSHLCEALLAHGRDVVCIDNFQRGSVHNLAGLIGEPKLLVVSHDAARRIPDDLPRFDEIYHFAAPAPRGPDAARLQARIGARLAMSVLERAARDGARVLLASSSAVYGPARPYARAEWDWRQALVGAARAGEAPVAAATEPVFVDYAAKLGVGLKVARIFSTYGPRMHMDGGCEVASLVAAALRGEPLTLPGDGRETRAFCFIEDVVEGCIRLMEAGPEVSGPVNIGDPAEVSVLALASAVLELTASASPLIYRPPDPEDEARRHRPDISRAAALLGWRPKTPLNEGLKLTIADFAARMGVAAQLGAARRKFA